MSSNSRPYLSFATEAYQYHVQGITHHVFNLGCAGQIDDNVFSKYYALATCTILFYDYLLMLSDEVRLFFSLGIWRSLLRPHFVEDRIRLVRKENVECVRRLKRAMSAADLLNSILAFHYRGFCLFDLKSGSSLTSGSRIGIFR